MRWSPRTYTSPTRDSDLFGRPGGRILDLAPPAGQGDVDLGRGKPGEGDIEAEPGDGQRLKLDAQKISIPDGAERELVVGQPKRAFFKVG
ncbi:hypothetical protein [Brevundimonas sp.]|uniref:hypothetical protein n=1 Tax=Brevundimonas sp. TaxID=1871086 RepID=UPI003F72386C